MNIARKILLNGNYSIVVVKNGNILVKKKGDGIKPIIEIINEFKDEITNSIIGDKILGKASALLCVYSKVKGVYSPQATKTAIAILIKSGIPVEIDKIVPYITNKDQDGICPFEKMIMNVNSEYEAYEILNNKFKII